MTDKADKDSKRETSKKNLEKGMARTFQAGAEFLSGMANAMGNGLKRFGDEVDRENVNRMDSRNGVVRGMVEGWARALEEAPDVLRRSYDCLTQDDDEEDEEETRVAPEKRSRDRRPPTEVI